LIRELETQQPLHIPFHCFKELRRLNESLHVRDEAFSKSRWSQPYYRAAFALQGEYR
jgi:hypothetical protein